LSPEAAPSSKVTLWVTASDDHVHVTVVPTVTLVLDGEKKLLFTVTALLAPPVWPPPPGAVLDVPASPPHAAAARRIVAAMHEM
jgi:hypothetical protein